MKIFKIAFLGALMMMTLTGCGCSTQENYENTVATHTPSPTATESTMDKMKDDAGDMIDDTGKAVEDAGEAINDAAKDTANAVR